MPCCGYIVDSASVIGSNKPLVPKKGDFTICLRCGSWLRFTDATGAVRPFEAEDILDLDADQISNMRRVSALIRGGNN